MEGCKHEAQFGSIGEEMGVGFRHRDVVTHPAANHIDERMEHAKHPYHAEDIEQHVRKSSTAGLCVGRHGYDI